MKDEFNSRYQAGKPEHEGLPPWLILIFLVFGILLYAASILHA
jgi:hypothetical protein